MSRVRVLLVVTSTVAALTAIVTIPSLAVPELSVNVGVPNVYPVGAVGGVSLTVQTVPVGIPLIVDDAPAFTDTLPSCAVPSAQS